MPLSRKNNWQRQKAQARKKLNTIKERKAASTILKNKLIGLLQGDRKKAEKLVAKERFGNESKYSENYCYWLAIRRLEEKQQSNIYLENDKHKFDYEN